MRRLLIKEENEYYKKKEIIEAGHLTSRGLTKFLKPYRNYIIFIFRIEMVKKWLKITWYNIINKVKYSRYDIKC